MADRVTILPCEWCDRTVGCPCITGYEAIRLRPSIEARHRQAVKRATRPPVAVTIAEAMDAAGEPHTTPETPARVSLREMRRAA